ncbi:hypothetical protein OIY81_2734 [Cryptosporidium canis]|nr:hypothetical protein OIY81_2734 [Cryptosporidium canis]
MGTKLVNNIKNFIISGRSQNNIKGLVRASYPNGYRNFGPDLDRVMLPLNKKYVDASKLLDSIGEEASNSNGGCSGGGGGKDNYYILVLKCLVEFIQWDIKKERENYARYGMFLFLKLVESSKDHWVDPLKLTGFIRSQSEAWLSKDSSALQYFGKWILLGNMKRSLERNIHMFHKDLGGLSGGGYASNPSGSLGHGFVGLSENSLPIKMCTLNHKLVEMLCKCIVNINTKFDQRKEKGRDKSRWNHNASAGDRDSNIKESSRVELIEIGLILEIILLGFMMEGSVFEEKSRSLISGSLIPCLASIIDSKLILNYGLYFHNVRYYLDESGPGRSYYSTLRLFREDSNLFFQGDKAKPFELAESLYIKFLYLLEALSIIFSKEPHEDKALQSKCSDALSSKAASDLDSTGGSMGYTVGGNELGLLQRFKVQDRINILPLKFKSLNDKLYSLSYYPYILTSDICLSICRGNSEYTVELITLLTCAIRYHTINTSPSMESDTESGQRVFYNSDPFFIVDELFVSISGGNDETPKSILYYETPQYCYSLLRCLHRVLCCCPRSVGISRLVSTLVNLIDVILPLYDLNGTLCSRSKNLDGQIATGGGGSRTITGEIGKCALLLRNAAFQVLFDIMCILSDTSQVFYVIRVLVKVRDWCGSCLLDLIRRCQRLATQSSEALSSSQRFGCRVSGRQVKGGLCIGSGGMLGGGGHKQDKLEVRSRVGALGSSLMSNETSNTDGSRLLQNTTGLGLGGLSFGSGVDLSSNLGVAGGGFRVYGIEVDLDTVNPSFWSDSKILEIAGINRKWITGQIGNSGSNYISMNFTGNGLASGGVVGSLSSGNNISVSGGISSGLSSDIIVSSKTTQVIFNRPESMGSSSGGSVGAGGGALRAEAIGGSATSSVSSSSSGSAFCSPGHGACSVPKTAVPPHTSNYCYDYSSEDEDYDFDDVNTSSDDEGEEVERFRDSERRRRGGYRSGMDDDEDDDDEDDDDDENDDGGGEYEEDDDDYWEADQKLLELIRLRPISSIINAQPPTAGILRRTVSSDLSINKGAFSKIGSISFWTKHNSAPPKTLSSMKRVCFAEVAQIY